MPALWTINGVMQKGQEMNRRSFIRAVGLALAVVSIWFGPAVAVNSELEAAADATLARLTRNSAM